MHRKILISGGSGFIGGLITNRLQSQGDEIAWLVRKSGETPPGVRTFGWNPVQNEMDLQAIHWADYIINLAGESIGNTRWTDEGKARILNSRIQAVQTLRIGLQERKSPIKAFVGVSGIGYYGPSSIPKAEADLPGHDFPAQVALAWENAYDDINQSLTQRKTIIRLAPVLSVKTGALPPLMAPVKWGLGAPMGRGNQPFPWIHALDAAHAFVQALEWDTVVNLAAPEILTNQEITNQIASVLHRPIWLPAIPEFALQLMLGERRALVTEGTRPDLHRLSQLGFEPRFPTFIQALQDLLARQI